MGPARNTFREIHTLNRSRSANLSQPALECDGWFWALPFKWLLGWMQVCADNISAISEPPPFLTGFPLQRPESLNAFVQPFFVAVRDWFKQASGLMRQVYLIEPDCLSFSHHCARSTPVSHRAFVVRQRRGYLFCPPEWRVSGGGRAEKIGNTVTITMTANGENGRERREAREVKEGQWREVKG